MLSPSQKDTETYRSGEIRTFKYFLTKSFSREMLLGPVYIGGNLLLERLFAQSEPGKGVSQA